MPICENCIKCTCKVYPQLSRPIDTNHRPILVIGETVTAVEARKGEVMTGSGGQILRQTMYKVGLPIDSNNVTYTVAITCAVPKKKGNNTFPNDAIVNCRTRLLEEIAAINPELILVCGKIALQTLLGDTKIKVTSEYGRARKYDFCGDATVMPIMNPGLILRSPNDYKPFLAMLTLAATLYGGGSSYNTGTVSWEVLDTEHKCMRAWGHLMDLYEQDKLPYVTHDIETTGLDYRTAEFLVMGITYEKNKCYVIPREMKHLLHNFISGSPWKIVWHHGKYDKKITWKRKLGTVSIDHDTIYMHYVLDETSAHDLEHLSKVFLQAEAYKYKMNQNWNAVNLDSYSDFFEALCERVAVDCDYTFQLTEILLAEVAKVPCLQKLYDTLIIPAANYLSRVEQNGILVDPFFLQELNGKYEIEANRVKDEIQDMVFDVWDPGLYMKQTGHKTAPSRFNPGAPDQMAWLVFDVYKLRPRVKKGRSTAEGILESIDNLKDYLDIFDRDKERAKVFYETLPTTNKFIAKVLEYRGIIKEWKTYVVGTLEARDDDGRVRTTFNLHIAATGRLTSKEPNVQNQPSANGIGNIRRCFLPRPNYVLGEIDYAGAELRWLAFLSKCPVLGDVFINNRNLHVETATGLYGPHFTKAQKLRAKAVNFGIPYGREEQSFVDEFGISKAEAISMIQGWLNLYHGARDYLQWCADQVVMGNYLETPFGRRRRFGLVTPESLHSLQNQARNFPIQSSSSDLLLVCAMAMEDTLLREWKTYQDNLIHDSILNEIPADVKVLMEVGKYMNDIMVKKPIEMFNCPIPFKTDFEIGCDWGNLVAFNWKTGMCEEEDHDGNIITFEFDKWYRENCHYDVYKKLNLVVEKPVDWK